MPPIRCNLGHRILGDDRRLVHCFILSIRSWTSRIAGELSITAISHPPSNDRPSARATFSVEGGTGDGSGRRQRARTRAGSYTYGETVLGARASYPNTVIYFANGYEAAAAKAIASAAGLDHHYLVPGTSIRLATNRSLSPSSSLAALLTPAKPPR